MKVTDRSKRSESENTSTKCHLAGDSNITLGLYCIACRKPGGIDT
jgi:hypothetical protein